MLGQRRLDGGVLVGGVVVQDQVDRKPVGNLTVDDFEEGEEILVAEQPRPLRDPGTFTSGTTVPTATLTRKSLESAHPPERGSWRRGSSVSHSALAMSLTHVSLASGQRHVRRGSCDERHDGVGDGAVQGERG